MHARGLLLGLIMALAPGLAPAQPAPQPGAPVVRQVSAQVDREQLRRTISRLVGFGTRHTLSDTHSPTRGIGAARAWVRAEFEADNAACHGCLSIVAPTETVTGERIPQPTEIVDVLAVQQGTDEPDRVLVISAHLDSRVTDVMNATADAPGADDDGSGVAAVLEAARVLSQHHFRATIVYAVLQGEEQNLFGGRVLAHYAQAQHWRVEADLNNDIIGNTHGADGTVDNRHIRVFSEGTRTLETPAEANRRRYNGGELDSPSRNLARYIDGLADRYLSGVDVVMVYRTDRFSRGGDQVRMLEAGFPSVRFTEARENYNREHQDVRTANGIAYGDTIDGIDFDYLAQVTRLNIVALASLAAAPAPPTHVEASGAVSSDTTLTWEPTLGATRYRVWWRSTTEPQWRFSRIATGSNRHVLPGVIIDDWFFGVQAVGPDGAASPVVFPGAAGAFFPAAP
jgi:hypothetical protein